MSLLSLEINRIMFKRHLHRFELKKICSLNKKYEQHLTLQILRYLIEINNIKKFLNRLNMLNIAEIIHQQLILKLLRLLLLLQHRVLIIIREQFPHKFPQLYWPVCNILIVKGKILDEINKVLPLMSNNRRQKIQINVLKMLYYHKDYHDAMELLFLNREESHR